MSQVLLCRREPNFARLVHRHPHFGSSGLQRKVIVHAPRRAPGCLTAGRRPARCWPESRAAMPTTRLRSRPGIELDAGEREASPPARYRRRPPSRVGAGQFDMLDVLSVALRRWMGGAFAQASVCGVVARSLGIRLHCRQFVAARVAELKSPAAGETENRFGDLSAGRRDRAQRRLQIRDLDDR
jgi:hypothetical protein